MVEVPAGVDHGSTLRLPGRGAGGRRGGAAGDLYVHLRVREHATLTRNGVDLLALVHLGMTQAALGAAFPFETLDGVEELTVPAGTQSGREIRLRGRGVPHLQGRGRGDLILTVVVDTPTELTKEQEELVRRLAEIRGEDVAPRIRGSCPSSAAPSNNGSRPGARGPGGAMAASRRTALTMQSSPVRTLPLAAIAARRT